MVKGIFNAFDHMGFCLVLNLTTTCTDGKWAVIWPPNFATKYIEDIYFFEVNTKYISSNVLKISEISRVRSTSEIADIFNT